MAKSKFPLLSGLRYSDAQKAQWRKWYEADKLTVSQICEKTGASRHTVMRWLKGHVKLRGNSRAFNRKAILGEIKRGKLTQIQIAKKFGCSQRLVSDVATGKVLV